MRRTYLRPFGPNKEKNMSTLNASNNHIAATVSKTVKTWESHNAGLSSEFSTLCKGDRIRLVLMGFNSSWNLVLVRVYVNDVLIDVVYVERQGPGYGLRHRVNFGSVYDQKTKSKGVPAQG